MPLPISELENYDTDDHKYRVYAPVPNSDWLEILAREYIRLRTNCLLPLQEISYDGLQMSVDQIRMRIQKATVPRYKGGKNKNFDVVRSDFGELIAYFLLEEQFGTIFGFKSLRCRELVQQPARGVDGIGIERGNPLTLIISEVKVSDSALSPPGVVDQGNDCLRKQHIEHLGDREKLADKIWDKSREIGDASLRDAYITAALCLESSGSCKIEIVIASVLVRPQSKYRTTDFGTFRTQQKDYAPGKIRFLIFGVHEDIEPVIQTWDHLLQAI